ncbi:MAG: 30S ribosomal protein S17 [Chlamydiae bacterium]|nr:30S ribosomal protein S17 [Chlamydiota bacterium]
MKQEGKTTRKTKTGVVVSNKMQKTAVVRVERTIKHPIYGKVIKRAKKYYAHNENNDLQIGDEVVITETRPFSKLKRWRIVEKEKA